MAKWPFVLSSHFFTSLASKNSFYPFQYDQFQIGTRVESSRVESNRTESNRVGPKETVFMKGIIALITYRPRDDDFRQEVIFEMSIPETIRPISSTV